jgi:hypothetical protein
MYDYLNIGVWSTDQPFYDLNEYFNFLQLINKAKLDGVSYETSAAGFGSGLLQFFVLRFLCKPYANADAEFDQFCNHSFGAAAKDIKMILREWYFSDKYIQTMYDRPTFSEDDLGRMINTYNNAAKVKGLTNNQSANLFAVKAYLVFLCKYYEFWGDIVNRGKMIKNNQLKVNHLDDMLQFTWKLYELKILHNTQLNDVIKTYIPENKAFADKWDYYQSNQFTHITNGMNETVDREFNIITNRYSKLATPNYTLPVGFFENAAKLTADSILIETTDEIGYNSMRYSLNVFCSTPGKMSIRFAAGDSKTKDVHEGSVGFIAINSSDFSFMQRQFILQEKRNGNFVINFPKKGHYVLTLSQRLATHIDFVIKPGKQLLYVHKNVLPAQGIVLNDKAEKPKYDNQYIAAWVPNVDSVYYNIVYPETYNMNHVVNHKGQKLPLNTTIGPHHISCAIQPSDKNNFLYFHNTLFRWGFVLKNVPSYFFFLKKPIP